MASKINKKLVVKSTPKNSKKKTTVVKKTTTKKSSSKSTTNKVSLNKIPVIEIDVVDANNVSYIRPFENQLHTPSRTQVFQEEISSLKKINLENNQEIENLIKNNEWLEVENKKNQSEILNFQNQISKLEHDLSETSKKNQDLVNELKSVITNNKNLKNQLSQQENNNKRLNEQIKNIQAELKTKAQREQKQTIPPPPPPLSKNIPEPENWQNIKNELEKQVMQLNKALEEERQQMINKLQVKSKEAQKLVDEKLVELEKKKQDELTQLKLKINEEVISQFLDPILLLDQTIESSANNSAIYNYLQGFKMIVNMFKDKLSILGTEEIVVNVGDEFNENWMSAFDAVSDPKYPPNVVIKVVSKGYALKGKVIKYTSVVVSK